MRDPIPDYCIVLSGIALQWFSQFDIMDGMRARRLKCGSPLGRIIDEGIFLIIIKLLYSFGLNGLFMCCCLRMLHAKSWAWFMFALYRNDQYTILCYGNQACVMQRFLNDCRRDRTCWRYINYYIIYLAELIFSGIFIVSGGIMGTDKYEMYLGEALGIYGYPILNYF